MVTQSVTARWVVVIASVCWGCQDARPPAAPTSTVPLPPVIQPPRPSSPLPPLSGAFTTYAFSEPLANFGVARVSPFTEQSSFALYDNGAFYLEYKTAPARLQGRYERDGERIDFHFGTLDDGVDAVGTVQGERLEVRYGPLMQHSDYEDAVYRRFARMEGSRQTSRSGAP